MGQRNCIIQFADCIMHFLGYIIGRAERQGTTEKSQ